MPSSNRRVVITACGVVCPLGKSKEALWDAIRAGQSGVKPLQRLPTESLPVSFGGEVSEFSGHIDDFGVLTRNQTRTIRKGLKIMCREIQMGVAAAQLALNDANLAAESCDPDRTGVVFGSDYITTTPDEFAEGVQECIDDAGDFDFSQWAERGLPKVTPLWLLKYLPNMPACHVAIYNDFRGPNNSITMREASANLALGEAYSTIVRDSADVVLAGSTGTRLHPLRTVHAALQEELAVEATNPAAACRPFDRDRTGMVVGEGSATLVLEDLQHARRRGATILGELIGYGSSTVMDRNSIARRDVAVKNAMQQALSSSHLTPGEIGHVHAHGLSTLSCDIQEANAINTVFAEGAPPVTAAKSYFGNLGAASGMVELVASIMSMRDGSLLPILNFQTDDPDCPIPIAKSFDLPAGQSVLNVNVSPQGQASAVVVRTL